MASERKGKLNPMGKNIKSIDHVRCGPPPRFSRMCGTSLKTINNIIHKDLELDTRRKGKVHKLTPFHMKNRATNARKLYEEHLAGSRSEYTATLDEAWMYVTYCNGIRKICYIKRGNQVPDNWVHQCSETFPKGFMVVGVMTGRGVLPLIKVPSKVKVNSEFYIECVLKPVIEQLKDLYPGEMDKVFLHHDKASSHTSNKTQQFLQEMKDTLGLNFIRNSDIPVKSPDASPLDFYGFGMLKQRLFNRRPKTEAGLWKAAQEEWSNVSLSKVKEVFAAWKVRCREIAKKKGKHIEHMKKIHVRKINPPGPLKYLTKFWSKGLTWQRHLFSDEEQQLYTPKIVDIVTAVIEMYGGI
ncbi:IKK1 [Cordylochernes scorpioides]|uniref:IKK1 n=1 Tax=Cordylochernes scorpioides TaxID=51811 RepID=A0ABY6LHE3_9ARAC|nr:IKK1 [Cordylochernes scorpioides]